MILLLRDVNGKVSLKLLLLLTFCWYLFWAEAALNMPFCSVAEVIINETVWFNFEV